MAQKLSLRFQKFHIKIKENFITQELANIFNHLLFLPVSGIFVTDL